MSERLEINDTLMSAVTKLSEGNPGALSICLRLFKEGPEIDNDALLGGFAGLMALDSHGIYGADIWMLFKDVCRENLVHTVAVLRAAQLGLLPEWELKNAIHNRGAGVDVQAVFDAVCERLPNFKAANALEAAEVLA